MEALHRGYCERRQQLREALIFTWKQLTKRKALKCATPHSDVDEHRLQYKLEVKVNDVSLASITLGHPLPTNLKTIYYTQRYPM